MHCPRCGTATRADAQYCFRCGTPLTVSAEFTTRTTAAPSPSPPGAVRPPSAPPPPATRSRGNWWLFLLAGGVLLFTCLVCACALSIYVLWSAGDTLTAQTAATATVPASPTPHPPTGQPPRTPGPTPDPPSPPTPTPGSQPPVGTTVGRTAPDFTLQDLDGRSVTLSESRGTHVVLIDFWATWCGPCKKELPHIQEMYTQYKDRGFTVLAINARESANQARGFIADNNFTFPVLLDREGEVLQQYSVRGIPSAFIVDTQGVIQKVQVGYRTGMETELARIIESLLPR